MTAILIADALRDGGYGSSAIVDAEYDFAHRENLDRIAGAPKSAHANSLLDQAQLAYELHAELKYGYEVVIIRIKYEDARWVKAQIEWAKDGALALSYEAQGETLASCIRSAFSWCKTR